MTQIAVAASKGTVFFPGDCVLLYQQRLLDFITFFVPFTGVAFTKRHCGPKAAWMIRNFADSQTMSNSKLTCDMRLTFSCQVQIDASNIV